MAFSIGDIYRYSDSKDTTPFVDGLPNFFYETAYTAGESSIKFQKGIHNIKSVSTVYGESRIPAIIISSSPHKAGTDMTPWEDQFDPDNGRILYYGDNKTNEQRAEEAPGNKLLLSQFLSYQSPSVDDRSNISVPLIFFKRVEYDGRKKGNLMFQGYGIIESAELVTQFDPRLSSPYFSNYLFTLCVFSLKSQGEKFSWDWINARRDSHLSNADTLKLAPSEWQQWVKSGSTSLYSVRRRISAGKIIKDTEQIPEPGSREEATLKAIYDYYFNKKHEFEPLALKITQEIFAESGLNFYPGWVTNKSNDRGIDFVGRVDISSEMSSLKIVVLGQAKCEKLDVPTNGVHIARTVARLKRGWFGVYVTTSYFSKSVQEEVMDDQYPIMMVCGKKVAETVEKILFKRGMSLIDFLEEVSNEYKPESHKTEEILIS